MIRNSIHVEHEREFSVGARKYGIHEEHILEL